MVELIKQAWCWITTLPKDKFPKAHKAFQLKQQQLKPPQ